MKPAPERIQPPTFGSYYQGRLGGLYLRWIDLAKIRLLRREFAKLPPGARVLDLGCGAGLITAAVKGRFPELHVFAGEGETALARLASSRGLEVIRLDFNAPLPFATGSFDCVVMVDTIEHVDSRNHVLAEVVRILSPKGAFVAFTPPYDTLAWLLAEKIHRVVTRRPAGHVSPFTRESLAFLLSKFFSRWRIGFLNCGMTLYGVATGHARSADP